MEDSDDIRLAEWLQNREVIVAPLVVGRSVGAVAREPRVHPLRGYLDSLQWDDTPRLETWTAGIWALVRDAHCPFHSAFG